MKIAILVSKYTPKRINRSMFSKISSREIPHSKRISKIIIFYIKNGNFWKKNTYKIWSKYTLKRTKLHRFKKISRGSMPPNPLAMRMASPCAACRFATCKFPNLKKNFLAPPPKSWGRPWYLTYTMNCEMLPYFLRPDKLLDVLILSINWSCMSCDISLTRELFLSHIDNIVF